MQGEARVHLRSCKIKGKLLIRHWAAPLVS